MISFLIVAAPLMGIVSFVLVFLSFTKLGKMKIYRFVIGEFAIVTAIAYAFLTALLIDQLSIFGMVAWFIIGSIEFAFAAFRATE